MPGICFQRRRASGMLVCTLICLLGATAAHAQGTTATLSGNVVDPSDAVVPGVNITLLNADTALRRETTTSREGYFILPLLPPGRYSLRAQLTGFIPIQMDNLVLNVNDQLAVSIRLKVAAVGESITVVAEPSRVNTSPAVGTVIDRQFVENLPLNGRSFQTLLQLTPGVVLSPTSVNEQGQFAVNGQRTNANYFMVDGVAANIAVTPGVHAGQQTAGTLPGVSAFGSTNSLVSVDALQEFRVLTSNFAPEHGRTPGGQVLIETRSGTNEFHGTLFDYFRNDVLDANDWFANSRGLKKPPLRQNDFGGVIGGPILRGVTFFFFSYEGLRLRLPQTRITLVPSVEAREIAPSGIQPFLRAFPVPNGPDRGNNFSEYSATFANRSTLDATALRVDQRMGAGLNLFGRYNHAPSKVVDRGSGRSLSNLAPISFRTQTLTAGVTLISTGSITNEFRLNYSRNRGSDVSEIDDFGGAVPPPHSVVFPSFASSQDSLFFFNLLSGAAWSLGLRQLDEQRQLNFVNTLSWVVGAHHVKFGVDYRHLGPLFDFARYSQQAIFSGGVNQAVAGRVGSVAVIAFRGPRLPRFHNLSLFGQDTWRATRRLTLTYGARWELNPPPKDRSGNDPLTVSGLHDPATLTLAPSGTPLYKTAHGNVAPRVGLAYELLRKPARQMVVRGGFGAFDDLGSGTAANAFGVSYPYLLSRLLSNVTFPLDPASADPPPFDIRPPYGTLWGVIDPNVRSPYTLQWNTTVEQSLGSSQTVTFSYVGATGRSLLRQEVLQNPNSNFESLFVTRSNATSDYHGLQIQFQRRLRRGLQTLASYTLSRSLDNVSGDSQFLVAVAKVNLDQEWGPSDFDVRHTFSGAVTYEVPSPAVLGALNHLLSGFSIDGLIVIRSGLPINVTTGVDAFRAGFVGSNNSRPDLVPGVPIWLADSDVAGGRRINRAAFSVPDGRQGTQGRNALRGFPAWQIDLAIRRQIRVKGDVRFQLGAEAFNIFNHPNFGNPVRVLTNSQFGQSTSMLARATGSGGLGGGFSPLYQIGGPRSLQLAAKVLF